MRLAPLAVLLLVSPIFAQRYDDTITVNVVDVPVYVERFGKPITGLTRDDFELFVDGRANPIEYFDVIDESTVEEASEPSVPPALDLRRRRLIVLLFDAGSPSWSLQRARKAAAQYVANAASGDTFAVATVSWSGVLFIVPFTSDRVTVQRAIATLRPSRARDPFRVATLAVERSWDDDGMRGAGTGGGGHWDGGHPGGFAPPAIAGFSSDAVDIARGERDIAARGVIENLNELADRLAPLEGRKEVVLLSEGHADPISAVTGAGTLHAIVGLHKRYRAAGIILNGVDISTPRAPGLDAGSFTPAAARVTPDLLTSPFLWALALDTGGIATTSLPYLQKRQRIAYVIGFRAPQGKRSSSIHVNVKNAQFLTDVRYRKSYTLGAETKDEGLFLADTLLNDIPQSGVTLDLNVNGTWVAASIPGVELMAMNEHRVKLDVYFYVFDEANRPLAWNRMQIDVDLVKGREFLAANPYTMRQEFLLDPGRYVAKALVRVAGTDRVGFRKTHFEVAR